MFEVEGGSAASVTYMDTRGQMSQETGAALPWRRELTVEKSFFMPLSLTATNGMNGGSGKITCRIIKDGKVVAENSGSGQFATVSCNGS
ncbi:hypothetical protein HUO13_22665 [Saccharopolyspora erythraea]|nr:hypothetical protein HUO13_22665 [Saccharopolyspora erythraea]